MGTGSQDVSTTPTPPPTGPNAAGDTARGGRRPRGSPPSPPRPAQDGWSGGHALSTADAGTAWPQEVLTGGDVVADALD